MVQDPPESGKSAREVAADLDVPASSLSRWAKQARSTCNALEVSRSGFYAWRAREPSARAQENNRLAAKIVEVHQQSRRSYGSPRVHAELVAQGFEVGRNRVARLMRENGIVDRRKPRFRKTTDSNHNLPVAANVLDRQFTASEPDRAWVAPGSYSSADSAGRREGS